MFSEFKVKSTTDVLILSQIALDYNEITQRESHNIIYEPSASYHKRLLCTHLPVGPISPVTLLFPNPRCQSKLMAVPFDMIAAIAHEFSRKGDEIIKQVDSTPGKLKTAQKTKINFDAAFEQVNGDNFYGAKVLCLASLEAGVAPE